MEDKSKFDFTFESIREQYEYALKNNYTFVTCAEYTLKQVKNIFKSVKVQQTYGLIELGVLRSKSKDDGSLWVKLGGEGYELRVVDNLLEIKADSAMLGYLNAESPFTKDGYFRTGDQVLQDGEYYKILGRKSELINVGGEKVFPQEVENTILQIDGISDARVFGEKHPLMGQIVCAEIFAKKEKDKKILSKEIKAFCRHNLKRFMVPVKIYYTESELFSTRLKKARAK